MPPSFSSSLNGGNVPALSFKYIFIPRPIWRRLLTHLVICADCFALASRTKARFQTTDSVGQLRHAMGRGEPIGETHGIVGKPVEGDLNLDERGSRLDQGA